MKMRIVILGLAGAFLILNSPVLAIERLVPSQYSTIQAAIDDCNNGDVVIVAPGTYTGIGNRDLDFGGKAITVRSTNPNDQCVVAATVINCEGSSSNPHRGFYFHNGEGTNSVVTGLRITNGYGPDISIPGFGLPQSVGGGIFCNSNSSPTISKCIIDNNFARHGSGIFCYNSSSPKISHCIIRNNNNNYVGGGIGCRDGSNTMVEHCVITGNTGSGYGGFSSIVNCNTTISHCIIWNNAGWEASVNTWNDYDHSYLTISYSDIEGGIAGVSVGRLATLNWGAGNINSDPNFAYPENGNYHLSFSSPCIDAGDPNYVQELNETDIDGDARVLNGRIDIGADEFVEGTSPSRFEVWPTELEFRAEEGGPNPEAQILSIRNIGLGALNWEITTDCLWAAVEPNSGSSVGEVNEVAVTVDVIGLTLGRYDCNLTISDPCAENNPQIVNANLIVTTPEIGLSTTQFDFSALFGGANPADQMLTITNSSVGTLNWSITEDCNWLMAEPNSGSSTGEADDVDLSVDITGLTGGSYTCQLTVSDTNASNSPQIVDVNLVVIGPIIELSAAQFGFAALEGGANPDGQILSISNGGVGTINWQITEDCNWLTVVPNSGSSTGEADDVNLGVDITGLTVGTYNCQLTVSDTNAANSPQIVSINLYVCPYFEDALYVPSEYSTIQSAIDAAVDGNTIIVAPGTYTGTGNKNLDFGGKAITVRSFVPEDLCIVAATIIDCENSGRGCYFHSGEGPNSVVSGLTIKRGRITGAPAMGGGIYCSGSSPTIEKCTIISNQARGTSTKRAYGGGIYCSSNSNPEIFGCTISYNIAKGGYGSEYLGGGNAYGGGIFCSSNSQPTIENCIIANNAAEGGLAYSGVEFATGGNGSGGGIYGTEFKVRDCTIIGNRAEHGSGFSGPAGVGGGIYFCGNSVIDNCLIVYNSAGIHLGGGGGVQCCGAGQITNCTICFNSSVFKGGGILTIDNAQTITNCIIWNNTGAQIDTYDGSPTVTVLYSDVQDGYSGTGNINTDPCFVTGPLGDYYLSQVAAGQAVDSPCVDAGSDTAANLGMDEFTTRTDQVVDESIVDMGYHFPAPLAADINKDCVVDMVDYAILTSQWRQEPGIPSADIAPPGGDGKVDEKDLAVLVDNWLWEKQ